MFVSVVMCRVPEAHWFERYRLCSATSGQACHWASKAGYAKQQREACSACCSPNSTWCTCQNGWRKTRFV